jgi:hypothetical protein
MTFPGIFPIRAFTVAAISLALSVAVPRGGGAQDALPPAEQLTARYAEAIGGRAAVLAHRVTRSTGTFEMPAAGLKGELLIVTQAPNRTATRITIPGMGTIRSGYDGEVGWSVEPMAGPRLLSGGELDVMRDNANALAAVRDASLFRSMQTIERAVSGGQPCYRVRLVWRSGRESHDCYHEDSGLLIETTQEVESPVGTMRVTATMSDYREFGGVLFPTRTILSMMGAQQVLTVSAVEFEGVDTSAIGIPDEIRRLLPGAGSR